MEMPANRHDLLYGVASEIASRPKLAPLPEALLIALIARAFFRAVEMSLAKTLPIDSIPEAAVDAILREETFGGRLNGGPGPFPGGTTELESLASEIEIQSELSPMHSRVGELFTSIGVPDWGRLLLIGPSIEGAARELGMDVNQVRERLLEVRDLVQRSIGPAR